MTSTSIVQAEIERFLRSSESEVLCITGDWGVGKTYNWQTTFDRLRAKREIGLMLYSYVSLFGINSLETFKQAIFENLEFIAPEGRAAFDRIVGFGNRAFQQSKKAVGAVSAIPIVGDAISKLSSPFLFSAIRSQIVCIDDLERRGDGLSVKDVFGLASYLREQRNCKIVFLLNQEKLGDSESIALKEFKDYFEKVVDTKLVFAPTAAEAAEIAYRGDEALLKLISEYSVKLGVKNIRVLKKTERLIRIVLEKLQGPSEKLVRQVVHSMVMFGWCQFDSGAHPPSLQYLREGALLRIARNQKQTPDEERWDAIRGDYDFGQIDDFDLALLESVESGIVDEGLLRTEAAKQEGVLRQREQANSFSNSFRLLHSGFGDNQDEVCRAIVKGVEDNINIIALSDLNQVVEIFNRLGEAASIDHIVAFAEKNAPPDFWLHDDPFNRPINDERLRTVIQSKRVQAKPQFDFERDLLSAAETYDPETIAALAKQAPSDFLRLFDAKSGVDLRKVIRSALAFRKISNASSDMRTIVHNAEQALRIIGKRNAVNAFRVENYGVSLDPPSVTSSIGGLPSAPDQQQEP